MQKYRKIKKLNAIEFRRLSGVRPDTFQEMVAILQDAERNGRAEEASHIA